MCVVLFISGFRPVVLMGTKTRSQTDKTSFFKAGVRSGVGWGGVVLDHSNPKTGSECLSLNVAQ